MTVVKKIAGALGAIALFGAGAADAALIYVGSWQLNGGSADGRALSAQQAAAQIFGGLPADYSISTAGDDPGDVDLLAFYSVLGSPGSIVVGDQSATVDGKDDLSAYTFDVALTRDQDQFVNYAFRTGVPEPATWTMLIMGFGTTGAIIRRRRIFPG
ncbi:PEPxxWA-CTERM sorting domain-containing protein [uncultured Phenylobacterium sp.]|uniref:PEPxxWA-CTERM sorting domain-containing protein n=1 Tax=uncultured Phenylobacterium sp. TaxID=349273 RepID=UPI0025EEE9A1|nr:PEPxxWA-CTERM sorting domain-containing protein [uncultured Phenylobacterium sp.]